MRSGLLVANGLVLAGIAWMVSFAPNLRASELVPPRDATELGDLPALESQAASAPTLASVAALASAYLDRDQPGLASAVIEKAPRQVRERPEVAQLEARALYHRGRVREALATAEHAKDTCADGCPAWVAARAARQVAFLEQVVAAGIDDPRIDPHATRAAYERSTRQVRLIAMR